MSADEQGIDQWKQKYYDQLDHLEKKENDWQQLETTLKRAIGRLSLAAEGQNTTLDRHITDLRSSIKNSINQQRVESIVDDISRILTQLEEKQSISERTSVDTLLQLVTDLKLPASLDKSKKKLIKQLGKSDDEQKDTLLKKTITLLKSAITIEATAQVEKPGLLDRLFNSDNNQNTFNVSLLASVLNHILSIFPWPVVIKSEALSAISLIKSSQTESDLQDHLKSIEIIINKWPENTNENKPDLEVTEQGKASEYNTYKTCLIELLNKLDNKESPNGKLAALRLTAQKATDKSELDKLSEQLSALLVDQSLNSKKEPLSQSLNDSINDPSLQPSIQELLIRLLEQLIVPADLQDQADKMKHRLEQDTDPANWKILLKDVATLINSIRSHMQKEKHEFENFLQQVTDRLKTMDQFLQTETENLQSAESDGRVFDKKIHLNVDEIRQDVSDATELASLKETVSTKLDNISSHIKIYRESENTRIAQSQEQVATMHTRMLALEKESETLKKVVIEKNKQAMFDTLTGIPNRLSYDKKIEEEVSRWKRFDNPLSMVIWDIDFFKKVNDTFGHKAGDKVLRTVAQLLYKRIRATDFLARYGGEEFVMLLPGTKQEETLRLVNEMRQQVETCGFHNHGEAVTITVSCGISSFNEGDSITQVFERADKALYKAKKNGRNQCVAASCLSD